MSCELQSAETDNSIQSFVFYLWPVPFKSSFLLKRWIVVEVVALEALVFRFVQGQSHRQSKRLQHLCRGIDISRFSRDMSRTRPVAVLAAIADQRGSLVKSQVT